MQLTKGKNYKVIFRLGEHGKYDFSGAFEETTETGLTHVFRINEPFTQTTRLGDKTTKTIGIPSLNIHKMYEITT